MRPLPVEFLPEAEAEVESAYDWYEAQRVGLGGEFLAAFDAVLSRVAENPLAFRRVARKTRTALLRRFPYLVLFVVEKDRILVTGVFHGGRDPRAWSDRVRERPVVYQPRSGPHPGLARIG